MNKISEQQSERPKSAKEMICEAIVPVKELIPGINSEGLYPAQTDEDKFFEFDDETRDYKHYPGQFGTPFATKLYV
jgi:hypothetical protein